MAHYWYRREQLSLAGEAVAVLAVVAAVMSIQPDLKGFQKAVWMLIIGACLFTEMKAIQADRVKTDQATIDAKSGEDLEFKGILTAQDLDFKATFDGLAAAIERSDRLTRSSQNGFAATFGEEYTNMQVSKEAVDAATGGDSFASLGIFLPSQLLLVTKNREVSTLRRSC